MLNKEKFAKEIVEIACERQGIAVVKGKLTTCHDVLNCKKCDFYDPATMACNSKFTTKEWANSEYVEPPVDWSKVAVDTPILVRDNNEQDWCKQHFAGYKNGRILTWSGGRTSWTSAITPTIKVIHHWNQAKLAESEE